MSLAPIDAGLKNVCRQLGVSQNLAMLDQAWNSEMGSWGNLASISALDNGALIVEVKSSPALQEITLRRKELLRRLNKHFPEPFIHGLTVRMAQHG
jgi:hypothetical protein